MICDKCGRDVSKKVLRPMGGGVVHCKDCYAGNPIVEEVKEVPEVEVSVSVSPPKQETTKVIKREKPKKKPKKKIAKKSK